jgi:hypothetical protein
VDQQYRWVHVLVVLAMALAAAGVLTQLLSGGSALSVAGPVIVLVVLGGGYYVFRRTQG